MKEKQGNNITTENDTRKQPREAGLAVESSGNHIKVVELLENAITPEPGDSRNSKWFVEIKVVDKITGLITPTKVLL